MTEENWMERIQVAEGLHHERRKRAVRRYGTLERVFFGALVLLAILVLAKFGTAVLPEYFR